jgi:fructokinase
VTDRPVLALGEILVDLIVDDGASGLETAGRFAARDGGAPANVAVGVARLGMASAFCGVCGVDPFGDRLRRMLQTNGVDDRALRTTDLADTSLAFAWKDAGGDGHFRLLRMADVLLDDDDVARAGIEHASAIVIGSVALAAEPSRSAIRQAVTRAVAAGTPVVLDLNVRPTLWPDLGLLRDLVEGILPATTLLKLSRDDARSLYGDGGEPEATFAMTRARGVKMTVMTDGGRGAWRPTGDSGAPEHVPAFPITPVEPTGAGDAFTAALITRAIASDWQGIALADIRFAAAAGALTATRPGAIDALPTLAEVEAFLAVHGG